MHAVLDIPRYLAHQSLFSDLPQAALARIASLGCGVENLDRGAMLFRAGDSCDAFYLVVSGHLKQFTLSDSGAEKVFELVGPGQPIAELCVFNQQRRSSSAQALTPALLVRIPKTAVTELVLQYPSFALRLLAGASQRLQGLMRDVESYCLHSGLRRVVGFLLEQQEAMGNRARLDAPLTVSLPVAKAAVAARLSLTPEYFSRVLRELEDAGLISVDRRDIRIHDARALAHYSHAVA
jgi:CRP-like cAMP-binding protein